MSLIKSHIRLLDETVWFAPFSRHVIASLRLHHSYLLHNPDFYLLLFHVQDLAVRKQCSSHNSELQCMEVVDAKLCPHFSPNDVARPGLWSSLIPPNPSHASKPWQTTDGLEHNSHKKPCAPQGEQTAPRITPSHLRCCNDENMMTSFNRKKRELPVWCMWQKVYNTNKY